MTAEKDEKKIRNPKFQNQNPKFQTTNQPSSNQKSPPYFNVSRQWIAYILPASCLQMAYDLRVTPYHQRTLSPLPEVLPPYRWVPKSSKTALNSRGKCDVCG